MGCVICSVAQGIRENNSIYILMTFNLTHLLSCATKVRYDFWPSRHTRMPRESMLKMSGLCLPQVKKWPLKYVFCSPVGALIYPGIWISWAERLGKETPRELVLNVLNMLSSQQRIVLDPLLSLKGNGFEHYLKKSIKLSKLNIQVLWLWLYKLKHSLILIVSLMSESF
jgi:hypothetical protein